jgi:uncharacterized membrane protein
VIFLMLSNHYPLAFATEYNWLIAALVFLMGVTIRHYFNSMHARKARPNWTWAVTAILFICIIWLSSAGFRALSETEEASLTPREQVFAEAGQFDQVRDIVLGRCSMCHAREPFYEGIRWAPKSVHLETDKDIAGAARLIYLQAAVSEAMPPANVTYIDAEERRVLAQWYTTSAATLSPLAALR